MTGNIVKKFVLVVAFSTVTLLAAFKKFPHDMAIAVLQGIFVLYLVTDL